jgi:Family of unknown function (DUF5335)
VSVETEHSSPPQVFSRATAARGEAMTARAIDKEDWESFCAALSIALEGSEAEIEVASLDLGDQIEKEWAPLIGITYDPEDDIFDIALDDDLDHIVNRPKELIADVDDVSISGLQITDADGRRHLIRLRDELMLPALQ